MSRVVTTKDAAHLLVLEHYDTLLRQCHSIHREPRSQVELDSLFGLLVLPFLSVNGLSNANHSGYRGDHQEPKCRERHGVDVGVGACWGFKLGSGLSDVAGLASSLFLAKFNVLDVPSAPSSCNRDRKKSVSADGFWPAHADVRCMLVPRASQA